MPLAALGSARVYVSGRQPQLTPPVLLYAATMLLVALPLVGLAVGAPVCTRVGLDDRAVVGFSVGEKVRVRVRLVVGAAVLVFTRWILIGGLR